MKVKTFTGYLHSDTVRTSFAKEIHRETIHARSCCSHPVHHYGGAPQFGRRKSRGQVCSDVVPSCTVATGTFVCHTAVGSRSIRTWSCGGNLVGSRRFSSTAIQVNQHMDFAGRPRGAPPALRSRCYLPVPKKGLQPLEIYDFRNECRISPLVSIRQNKLMEVVCQPIVGWHLD